MADDLVTRDAYGPLLPLSVVVHIDYQRAPSVVQRFGDVKKLITQTLDRATDSVASRAIRSANSFSGGRPRPPLIANAITGSNRAV